MQIWYTSDSHFDHANIIKYSGRPFGSTEEMNETLIARWNEVVKPQDHIWHLGDLTMHRKIETIQHRVLNRLNGHKRLILGNHDADSAEHYLQWFEKLKGCHVHDHIMFIHIPVHPRSVGRFKAIVHGHTHNEVYKPTVRMENKFVGHGAKELVPIDVPFINVCVEQTHYRPISLEEIKQLVEKGGQHV